MRHRLAVHAATPSKQESQQFHINGNRNHPELYHQYRHAVTLLRGAPTAGRAGVRKARFKSFVPRVTPDIYILCRVRYLPCRRVFVCVPSGWQWVPGFKVHYRRSCLFRRDPFYAISLGPTLWILGLHVQSANVPMWCPCDHFRNRFSSCCWKLKYTYLTRFCFLYQWSIHSTCHNS